MNLLDGLVMATGAVLLGVVLVDLVWTALAAGAGAGPVTARVAQVVWALTLRWHRSRERSRLLAAAGVGIVLATLLTWAVLLFVGWFLVFLPVDDAVVSSQGSVPADAVERIYFVGYTILTLGLGDYVAGDGVFQILTVLAVATGLVAFTLSVTYLVPVASAASQQRQLASYIATLGSSPEELVVRNWHHDGWPELGTHLAELGASLTAAAQQHLAYPIVHYFHSSDPRAAASRQLAVLEGALVLLSGGVAPGSRPAPAAVDPALAAVDAYLDTLDGAFVAVTGDELPAPSLEPLRRAGIPTVPPGDWEAFVRRRSHRRRQLRSYLVHDGWAAP